MDTLTRLLHDLRHETSPLVSPPPLAHSQELGDELPLRRHHVGPRPWYQALETIERD